jgi:hypothetical protein
MDKKISLILALLQSISHIVARRGHDSKIYYANA